MISAKDEENLRISCIGYKQVNLKVSDLPMVVKLQPLAKDLQEITVLPVPVRDVLSQTIKKLKKDSETGKLKGRMYFQRIVLSDSTETELVEMFTKSGSGLNLHEQRVISGVKGSDGTGGESGLNMRKTNIHSLMEVGPMTIMSTRWEKAIKPLSSLSMTKKYYDFSACSLTGESGERLYKLDFQFKNNLPKSKEDVHVLEGSAYIDAASCELLRFDGEVRNIYQRVLHKNMFQRSLMSLKIHIEYDHSRGTTEVSHISLQGGNGKMNFRALAFNIDDRRIEGEKGVEIGSNMMDAIESASMESPLWEEYNIVQRTAAEEIAAFGYSSGYSAKHGESAYEPDTAFTADPKLHALCSHLLKFGNQVPQEKVYVHMDNTSYFQGDTIWFSAYTRSTNNCRPSTTSGLLYVELLNSDGFLVNRQVIRMKNGRGYGNFVLNKQLMYSGFYELRAYTRWQLNFGCNEHWHSSVSKEWFLSEEMERKYYRDYDKLYSRVFPVYDSLPDSAQYNRNMTTRSLRRYFRKDPEKQELGVSFYPEGGNLVEGLPCRVAFEATWSDGKWAEGTLVMDGDSIPTKNRGRGVFWYKPEKGVQPSIRFLAKSGESVKVKFPQAEKQGLSLQLAQKDSLLSVAVCASENLSGESLGLTIMHEGCLEVFRPLKNRDTVRVSIPSLRSSGVHQVTVFNSEGHVLADRLVFVVKKGMDKPTLTVNCSNREYSPNEKIELDISAPSLKEVPGKGYTSIAVRDGNYSDYLFDNGSIFTEMLLSSEIKGFVPNPGWFFEKDDEEHRQALDLLMMTQGWRRFNWHDMAVEGAWKEVQPKEKDAMILNGKVYSADWMQDTDYRLQEQQYLDNLLGDAGNTSSNDWEEDEDDDDEKEDKYDTELRPFSREEITEEVSDSRYDKRNYQANLNKEVYIGTELLNLGTTYRNSKMNVMRTSQNRFEMALPYFSSPHVMYMDVWSNKEELKRKSNTVRLNKMILEEDKVYQICIDFPYPRFVKPYSFYQSHLSELTENESFGESHTLDDGTIVLREVPVHTKFGGLRQHDDSQPVLILGDLEVENLMTDAGIIAPGPDRLGRTLFGDMGFEFPFVRKPTIDLPKFDRQSPFSETKKESGLDINSRDSRIRVRYGIAPVRRTMENVAEIPKDSIYSPKNLKSYPSSFLKSMSTEERKAYAGVGAIEKYVVYTDYSPRMEGSKRYQGANLPEIFIAKYPYSDGSRNIIFADRCIVLPGFAQPDDFYHPDYSQHKLPEGQKDYRRTLYWNPNLQLDEKGEAHISFYNNSRTTKIVVDAEGQAADGTLLWYK